MENVTVFYIGSSFYFESGTRMSSYELVDGTRYDLGSMTRDLEEGKTVTIIPADDERIGKAHRKLDAIKRAK